jgi:hypothetical protein
MSRMRTLRWRDQWEVGDSVVWIDVGKANTAWSRDDYFIPVGAPDHRHKYDRFGEWLLAYRGAIWMPHVSLRYNTLSFTDGRHRFAWLRDHGVKALPVTTSPAGADRLSRVIGSIARHSSFQPA